MSSTSCAAEVTIQPVARAVLIIEDHPLVAQAMVGELKRTDRTLDLQTCGDASAAMAKLTLPFGTWFRIFLDLDIPGAHGLSLAREIKKLKLHDRCCVLTALDRSELIGEVSRLGFLGYIVKACPYVDFERALADAMSGLRTFPLPHSETHTSIRISRRQEQLLDAVRRGMSSREIAHTLCLSEGTVNNCINATIKALNASTRTQAVGRALELGLLTIQAKDDPALEQPDYRHLA